MNRLTFDCANPVCPTKVGVKSEHYPYCSKDCQRRCTPRTNRQRTFKGEVGIVLSKAPIHRKLGKQNWKPSDE